MEQLAVFALRIPITREWDAHREDDFDGLRDHVFRLVYALILDYAVAEDLAQDCLIRIWRNRDTWQEAANPKAWVTRLVVNRVRSHWRRTRSWVPLYRIQEVAQESDEQLVELRSAIGQLPAECREIVLLVGVHGASYAEAAVALGVPEGTVGSRFNRAKQLLREALR